MVSASFSITAMKSAWRSLSSRNKEGKLLTAVRWVLAGLVVLVQTASCSLSILTGLV